MDRVMDRLELGLVLEGQLKELSHRSRCSTSDSLAELAYISHAMCEIVELLNKMRG